MTLIKGAAPTGYRLGRSGWATIPFRSSLPPLDILREWVDESYRDVATKRRVTERDASR